jgi:uncharacterized protein (UPF0335 family)
VSAGASADAPDKPTGAESRRRRAVFRRRGDAVLRPATSGAQPSPTDAASAASRILGATVKDGTMTTDGNTSGAEKLKAYVERIENLLDEIDGLKDDLKDVKAQARDDGYNVLALVKLISIRRNKRNASRETELLNDLVLYAHATGTPLDFAFGEDDFAPPAPAAGRASAADAFGDETSDDTDDDAPASMAAE